jgi:hypothetical protein
MEIYINYPREALLVWGNSDMGCGQEDTLCVSPCTLSVMEIYTQG